VFNGIVEGADLYFLIAVRVLALIEVAPLLSSDAIPQVAKLALAGFTAAVVYPWVRESGYPIPDSLGPYLALLVGEALVGIVMGFFLVAVQAAFVTAGQFFSVQMGLSASEVYDPMAQVEIPLMGQYLNLVAMIVFLEMGGFRDLFLIGVRGSFQSMKAVDLVLHREGYFQYILGATSLLFKNALTLALPILGTLLVISVTMGLLSKAAPQMNLLTEGFPLSMGIAYLVLYGSLPYLMEAFGRLIDAGFVDLAKMIGGGG
jgi:flagellar biosynthetic protein FliR